MADDERGRGPVATIGLVVVLLALAYGVWMAVSSWVGAQGAAWR